MRRARKKNERRTHPAQRPAFTVEAVDYARGLPHLRARARRRVRPGTGRAAWTWNWTSSIRTAITSSPATPHGQPIGTGRLTPERKIGRMAVLPDWRGRGRRRCAAAGTDRTGPRSWAGTSCRCMRRCRRAASMPATASCPMANVLSRPASSTSRCARAARRRQSGRDPRRGHRRDAGGHRTAHVANCGSTAANSTRACSTGPTCWPRCAASPRAAASARILLQDAVAPQSAHAPLIGLSQRLPSAFLFRVIEEPVDRAYPSAFIANDGGGWYFRALGHRSEGETRIDQPARARQLQARVRAVLGTGAPVQRVPRAGDLAIGARSSGPGRYATSRPGPVRARQPRRARRGQTGIFSQTSGFPAATRRQRFVLALAPRIPPTAPMYPSWRLGISDGNCLMQRDISCGYNFGPFASAAFRRAGEPQKPAGSTACLSQRIFPTTSWTVFSSSLPSPRSSAPTPPLSKTCTSSTWSLPTAWSRNGRPISMA